MMLRKGTSLLTCVAAHEQKLSKSPKIVEKRKNGDSNCCEVVSNLGVEVGHLKTARTNTLVRDTADYRLSSKQIKRNELPRKDPNRT